ncbi:GNAT family N-acetyltransferase [Clostridium sp. 'White wine YQ']|uniref:GNAT family N-acetyltransferase n=1 Tax=Clostridium sp. 'White wine YQ' TaxID=3027474 RepID=UPI0023665F65|nr:GNAT family protein [Clostridium sp. 'White wine YQ']MDD7794203.1 GNAT family protein [Clostridium sp. 'White wine YQ']
MNNDIKLSFFKEIYKNDLFKFYLPEDIVIFTSLPKKILASPILDENKKPVVILLNEIPIGFFGLHLGDEVLEYKNNPKAILLRYFSINYPYQGKGYAKKALRLLPSFISNNFKEINEIVLGVNERNISAQKLYEKSNFKDTGLRRMGPVGLQYILSLEL